MPDVVAITPRRASITAREPAMAVPRDHCSAGRRGYDRGSAPDVNWLGVAGHHDPHHRSVAGQATSNVLADGADVVELCEPRTHVTIRRYVLNEVRLGR